MSTVHVHVCAVRMVPLSSSHARLEVRILEAYVLLSRRASVFREASLAMRRQSLLSHLDCIDRSSIFISVRQRMPATSLGYPVAALPARCAGKDLWHDGVADADVVRW